jgi:hypothetical protein
LRAAISAVTACFKGLAFGRDGDLYVNGGENNAVLRYDGTTGTLIELFRGRDPGSGGADLPL